MYTGARKKAIIIQSPCYFLVTVPFLLKVSHLSNYSFCTKASRLPQPAATSRRHFGNVRCLQALVQCNQFCYINSYAGCHRYLEQVSVNPRYKNRCNKCCHTRNRSLCCRDDRRKCHDSQCHIRYIVQERADKRALDLFLYQR